MGISVNEQKLTIWDTIYIKTSLLTGGFFFTFTQIPQPMHNSSDKLAIFEFGLTSMHSFPIRTTGHDFLHSWRHRFGLHLSSLTIAIRVCLSVSSFALFRDILKSKTSQKIHIFGLKSNLALFQSKLSQYTIEFRLCVRLKTWIWWRHVATFITQCVSYWVTHSFKSITK